MKQEIRGLWQALEVVIPILLAADAALTLYTQHCCCPGITAAVRLYLFAVIHSSRAGRVDCIRIFSFCFVAESHCKLAVGQSSPIVWAWKVSTAENRMLCFAQALKVVQVVLPS
jgi:hypothetical protein